ncbi:arginase family protein [Microbacterium sp. 4R-513]|uniref:arginase family protein n=1 Tax=Microbacterium sp. 4R-513 TaxID=2567934 RepID=UPI0013E15C5C|nr:arginase family protein [Microbacterium sp. 4R-513]QIG38231.1 arginase family protein [Microbacterium sp. 4R-513]
MARFVIVPQWQGSSSARAMQLIDGAQAIAGDLPRAACTLIDVPLEAGEALETGIHRYSSLIRTHDALVAELSGAAAPVIVVGGDCGVSVGAIGIAAEREERLAVVWFDAHPDLHTSSSSHSGAFGGMALSAVLGEGPDALSLAPGLVPAERVILAAARDYDAEEETRADEVGIAILDAPELESTEALVAALQATQATAVYIHVDLDVLDPSSLTGVTAPVPFGLTVAQLVAAIGAVRGVAPLAGATIAGFAPSSPAAAGDDLGAILRVVGALA